jgi:hypothetical protein
MAEFSKQYCEIYDEGFPWDFDIEEIADDIPKGYYKPIICEGFGFLGIGVDIDGNIEIFLSDPKDDSKHVRIDYKKYISLHKSKIQNNG